MDPTAERPASWQEKSGTRYGVGFTPKIGAHLQAKSLASLLEDKEKREAWKEELRGSMISAGVLSAVVTPFVIIVSKALRPDQQQITIDLLSQLVSRLDSSSFDLTTIATPPPFSPSASSIRVANLWFSSLIISLFAAYITITSLRCIREYEYERYSIHWTARERFAARNMPFQSFNKWFLTHISTRIPFILWVAMVLFLIGLVDFLLHLFPFSAVFLA